MAYEVKAAVSNGRERIKYMRAMQVSLRLLLFLATTGAAVTMVLSKEMATFPVVLWPGLPPIMVTAPAKYSYISAFVYFFLVHVIASVYALLSLLVGCSKISATSENFLLASGILDLITLVLVSTGCAAASAVGLMGIEGNSHLNWNKVCNRFTSFCSQVMAAIGASAVANVAFFLLVVVSIVGLHRRSSSH